jgi:hypothetical protein
MLIAATHPFLDILWTMFIFFAWVIRSWLLITVFADVSGGMTWAAARRRCGSSS